jgi:hypothetical protein
MTVAVLDESELLWVTYEQSNGKVENSFVFFSTLQALRESAILVPFGFICATVFEE